VRSAHTVVGTGLPHVPTVLPLSAVLTSQRSDWWNQEPEELRVLFTHTKGDHARARCALWSHQLGWEVRLTVNGSLIRSRVTRSIHEAMASREEWGAGMLSEGGIGQALGQRRVRLDGANPVGRGRLQSPSGALHPASGGAHRRHDD
jgi:hypothetical protein